MHRYLTLAAAAGLGISAFCSSASAQVGVEIYTDPPAAYDSYSVPRAYPDFEVRPRYPRWKGGCGTYRYWNGFECVDARYR